MKHRIALFIPSLRGGGAERVMINLAGGLQDIGMDVDLVMAQAEGEYLEEIPSGIRVVNLRARRILASIPKLAKYLKNEQPHALMSTLRHANLAAIFAKMISGTNTSLVIREAASFRSERISNPNIKSRVNYSLVKFFYPRVDALIALDQEIADDFINKIGVSENKVHLIRNPINVDELHLKSQEEINHPWLGNNGVPVFIAMGRLTRQKGFDILIDAFAQLRELHEAKLIIFGEGSERSYLEHQVSKCNLENDVELPGFKLNPFPYLTRASAFVLSSRWEGSPNALLQALALKVPSIATDGPTGASEIIEKIGGGILVPPENPAALAQAMGNVIMKGSQMEFIPDLSDYDVEGIMNAYATLLTHKIKDY